MSIQNLSVKWRIILFTGLSLVLVAGTLLIFSQSRTEAVARLIANSVDRTMAESARGNIQQVAASEASMVSSHFEKARQIGNQLSIQASHFIHFSQKASLPVAQFAPALADLVEQTVAANDGILGAVLVINSLNQDSMHGGGRGLNEAGRFSWYASRSGSSSVAEKAIPESEINDTVIGLSGEPENFWFACPSSSKKVCVMSPYRYSIEGRETLMTSVAIPVIDGERVVGVVSVDISLESLQGETVKASQEVFNGSGSLSIISPSAVIVGKSDDASAVGQGVSGEDEVANAVKRIAVDNQLHFFESSRVLGIVFPFAPFPGTTPWAVTVSVPQEVVNKPAHILKNEISSKNDESIFYFWMIGGLVILIGLFIVYFSANQVSKQTMKVVDLLRDFASAEGDLTCRLTYQSKSELGQLSRWFNHFIDKLQPVISKINGAAEDAHSAAKRSAKVATQTRSGMDQQFREIEQVATAAQEMSATSHDVARNALNVAQAAKQADASTQAGFEIVHSASMAINALAAQVESAMRQVEDLSQSNEKIGVVLEVIRNVAEQTNLLALNAAIEAARAGEMGRGFAVVADEVRNLAKRTQDSVVQINDVIDKVQQGTQSVVSSMALSCHQAGEGVSHVQNAAHALSQIQSEIAVISGMSAQIASAAEQQSQVSEDISRAVASIRDVTEDLSKQTRESEAINDELMLMAKNQTELVSSFRV